MQESLGVLLWHLHSHSHVWCICWTLTCVSDGCTRGGTRSSGGVKKTSWQSYNACKTNPPKPHTYLCLCVSAALWILRRRWDDCFSHHSGASALLKSTRHLLRIPLFLLHTVRLPVSRVMTCNNFICVNVFGGLFPLSTCRVSGSFSYLCTFSMSTPVFQSWEVVDFLDFKLFCPSAVKRRKTSVSAVTEVNRSFLSSHWRSHRACCQIFIIWGSHLGSRI